jgi:hypothetical protein
MHNTTCCLTRRVFHTPTRMIAAGAFWLLGSVSLQAVETIWLDTHDLAPDHQDWERPADNKAAVLGIQGDRQSVRDLWRQNDYGVFIARYEVSVPAHGVVFIRVGKGAQ